MKFELNTFHRYTTDEELLEDLKKVVKQLGIEKIPYRKYDEYGKYSSNTFLRQFGSWNNALEKAGLQTSNQFNVSNIELFEKLKDVWIKLGRQPVYRDMKLPLSKYSTSTYERKFGTWRKALEAFVEFINSDESQEPEKEETETVQNDSQKEIIKHKTKRNISERLKVQVLMKDGNSCKLCGITVTGENIHFDHIKPWSKGGETVLENLQVLCAKHNLAKGDLEYDII